MALQKIASKPDHAKVQTTSTHVRHRPTLHLRDTLLDLLGILLADSTTVELLGGGDKTLQMMVLVTGSSHLSSASSTYVLGGPFLVSDDNICNDFHTNQTRLLRQGLQVLEHN